MALPKVSTFRAVLKEYLPEYEPHFRSQSSNQNPENISPLSHKSLKEFNALHNSRSPVATSISPLREPFNKSPQRDDIRREKSALSKESSSLSETSRNRRKADLERYEWNYKNWEQAKALSRKQRTVQNKNKSRLQKELIRAQDVLYEHNRNSERRYEIKVREATKAAKQAVEEALVETCKESLENDRLERSLSAAISETRSAKSTKRSTSKSPNRTRNFNKSTDSQLTSLYNKFSSGGEGLSIPTYQRRNLTPFTNDDGEEDVLDVERDYTDVPWYQEQLYRLYGDSADYFIHPVMIDEEKSGLHPKLSEYGGRSGSDTLWRILRDESNSRLLDVDSAVPKDLKEAYSSFIRQNLSPDRKPLQRNFCMEDDVPYLVELLDKTKLNKIRNLRHKANLMYRLSKSNADKTQILTFNNPIPSLCDETVCVGDYIPSWDGMDVPSPLPDYYKHLSQIEPQETPLPIAAPIPPSPTITGNHGNENKLIFLTEQLATTRPKFRQKFAEQKEEPSIKPFCDFDSKPVMCYDNDTQPPTPKPSPALLTQFTSPWKPLSMDALMEYTHHVTVKGQGPFRNGRPEMWKAVSVAS